MCWTEKKVFWVSIGLVGVTEPLGVVFGLNDIRIRSGFHWC